MSSPVFKPDLTAEPWAALAQAARERYGKPNPYRLGYMAGLRGLDLPCPYHLQRSADAFKQGIDRGLQAYRREAHS